MSPETIPLPLRSRRALRPIHVADVVALRNLGQACAKCAEWGGLSDKAVALETGIDPGVWSRIKSGTAHPADDFLDVLMDAAGNEAPLLYLVHRRGYDPSSLRKLESEIERELRQAREELRFSPIELSLGFASFHVHALNVKHKKLCLVSPVFVSSHLISTKL